MGKRNQDVEQAKLIRNLRDQGMSDADIMAEHGDGKLSAGYRWLRANPGVDPRGETTTSAPRPARGGGSLPGSLKPASI